MSTPTYGYVGGIPYVEPGQPFEGTQYTPVLAAAIASRLGTDPGLIEDITDLQSDMSGLTSRMTTAEGGLNTLRPAVGENTNLLNQITVRSNNLFIKTAAYANTALAAGGGTPVFSGTSSLSDWIPVIPGQWYIWAGISRVTWFTASQAYISDRGGLNTGSVDTAPANAAYARLTLNAANLHTAQMNRGQTLMPYAEGVIPRIAAESAPDVLIATDQTDFFDQSSNLFDQETVTAGMVIPAGSGTPATNGGYVISDWIPIDSLAQYSQDGVILRATYYDYHRNYVADVSFPANASTFTTPGRARWMRLSVRLASLQTAQLNRGPLVAYQPGGATLKQHLLPASAGGRAAVSPILDADLSGVYTGPTLPDMRDTIPTSTAAQVHAEWDALAAAHPAWITRTQPGVAHDGQPVYCFTLTQPRPRTTTPLLPTPPRLKIFLIAGTHGNEKASVWTTLNLAKAMAEDWGSDDTLAALRFNIDWVIIPVANPSGYDANTRVTANGVDLARQWPTLWAQGTPGSSTYGGTAPLSEPETQAAKVVLDAHPDALAVIDFHNFHSPANNYDLIYACPGNVGTSDLFGAAVRRMDRKWKNDRPDIINQDPDQTVGHIDSAPGGSIGPEGNARGHRYAGTWELCWKVPTEPDAPTYSALAMTWGFESLVNMLSIAINKEAA